MKVKELAIFILTITTLMLLGVRVEATTGKINSETVRLRREANSKSTIIEQLDENTEVEILEEQDDWYKIKVKVNGEILKGYVSKECVKITDTVNLEEPQANTVETTTTNVEAKTEPTVEPVAEDIEPQTENVVTTTENEYTLNQETEIRLIPLISSKPITKISGKVKVIETINDWCRIESEKEIGWIRENTLKKAVTIIEETQQTEQQEVPSQDDSKQEETKTEETKKEDIKAETIDNKTEVKKLDQVGYVSADGLVVRKEPSTSSEELDSLSKNDKVVITGKIDGWYQIKLNGKTGYVSAKYISDTKIKDTKIKETTSRSGSTIKQEEVTPMDVEETTQKEEKATTTSKSNTSVVEYAKNYLGCKYVSGGSSPTTGFDCSGFTSYVYKNFGVSLSRSSKGQINDGVAVSKDELQPGDIVVFNNSGNSAIGHVGIYIGGDSFIHAANPRQGVVITSLSSSYYSKRYVGARRVK